MVDHVDIEANDHFCLSLTAFLWCLPLGTAALILSHKVRIYHPSPQSSPILTLTPTLLLPCSPSCARNPSGSPSCGFSAHPGSLVSHNQLHC